MNNREFTGFNNPPIKGDQKSPSLEQIKSDLNSIREKIQKKARETNTEASPIFIKRKNSIDEVEAIINGVINPHKDLNLLDSRKMMVSYSRRNEEWARKVSLALYSVGIIPWFDNQETNVSSDDNKLKAEENFNDELIEEDGTRSIEFDDNESKESIPKGIGSGNDWSASISSGISEGRYTTVLLTHDVFDKFDVVGGFEIPRTLNKENRDINRKVIVLFSDESVKERLNKFVEEKSGNEQYQLAIDALKKAPSIKLDEGDFNINSVELGNKILESFPEIKNALRERGLTSGIKSETQINLGKGNILQKIEKMKENVPGNSDSENKLYTRALDECKIILESQTNPSLLVKGESINLNTFSYPDFKKGETKYKPVMKALEKFDLKKEKDPMDNSNYLLFPISVEDINLNPEEFSDKIACYKDRGIRFWTLVSPGFWPEVSKTIEAEEIKLRSIDVETNRDEYFRVSDKIDFLKELQSKQGLEVIDTDLNDPEGLASYLLMKQALVDYEKQFNDIRSTPSIFSKPFGN